jgi:uncharacterized protein
VNRHQHLFMPRRLNLLGSVSADPPACRVARLVDAIRICAVHAATKALVVSFTETFAEEVRGTGVHVMAAHPGAVATGFFDSTSAAIDPAADAPEVVTSRTLDDYARMRAAPYPGRAVTRVLTWPAGLLPRTAVTLLAGAFSRRQGLPEVVDLA